MKNAYSFAREIRPSLGRWNQEILQCIYVSPCRATSTTSPNSWCLQSFSGWPRWISFQCCGPSSSRSFLLTLNDQEVSDTHGFLTSFSLFYSPFQSIIRRISHSQPPFLYVIRSTSVISSRLIRRNNCHANVIEPVLNTKNNFRFLLEPAWKPKQLESCSSVMQWRR